MSEPIPTVAGLLINLFLILCLFSCASLIYACNLRRERFEAPYSPLTCRAGRKEIVFFIVGCVCLAAAVASFVLLVWGWVDAGA